MCEAEEYRSVQMISDFDTTIIYDYDRYGSSTSHTADKLKFISTDLPEIDPSENDTIASLLLNYYYLPTTVTYN